MFAPRAEVQAARAAHAAGIAFCESTVSICSIEEVAAATPRPPWFQLYVMRERRYTESLLARASAAGAPVLLLTVDLAVTGLRHRDTRNGVTGSPGRLALARRALDLAAHPRWIAETALGGKPLTFGNLTDAVPGASSPTEFREWVDSQFDPAVTWDDVAWVRQNWPGKLVVKGVLEAEDARRAVAAGVDGIVVSNHGGRQLDGAPSTVRCIASVSEAVGEHVEVLVDGGVRSGTDVLRLLSLGARAVLLGRAWAWAVAGGGESGVKRMLEGVRSEIDSALALSGTGSLVDVGPHTLH
jgi:L-lactate dehydrogenase (cytochrome)